MTGELVREFTVAVFVIQDGRVLLLTHPKLARWLPPGGHIEPNELPDDAALREVEEETGILVRLVGGRGVPVEDPRQLVMPAGIQLENIGPGHQHVDLIYFAVPIAGRDQVRDDCAAAVRAAWFRPDELAAMGVDDEIQAWVARAVAETPRLAMLSEPLAGAILQ